MRSVGGATLGAAEKDSSLSVTLEVESEEDGRVEANQRRVAHPANVKRTIKVSKINARRLRSGELTARSVSVEVGERQVEAMPVSFSSAPVEASIITKSSGYTDHRNEVL